MKVEAILQRSSRHLSNVLKTVSELHQLDGIVQKHLSGELSHHYRTANYRHGELVLTTDSNAWATRMRYIAPGLIKSLQKESIFQGVKSISCLVDATPIFDSHPTQKQMTKKPNELTNQTKSLLQQVANHVQSIDLKRALLRLAR